MFVCTLRKGGLRKLAVVAVCGVVLAGAAITVGVVRNKGDADGHHSQFPQPALA